MSKTAPANPSAGKGPVIAAASGAVGLGALAAVLGTCCVAPWAVGLLGVAGAVALARMAVLTPYLMGGSVALLGVAFYFAYRPRRVCVDDACETTNRRRLRWIAWIGALVVAATLVVTLLPYL